MRNLFFFLLKTISWICSRSDKKVWRGELPNCSPKKFSRIGIIRETAGQSKRSERLRARMRCFSPDRNITSVLSKEHGRYQWKRSAGLFFVSGCLIVRFQAILEFEPPTKFAILSSNSFLLWVQTSERFLPSSSKNPEGSEKYFLHKYPHWVFIWLSE